MSKKNEVVTAEKLPSAAEMFAPARKMHEAARLHSSLGVAAMVMAGAEILRLRNTLGIAHGKSFDSSQLGKSFEGKTWEQVLQEETGISKSTAYRYQDMAAAAAKKVKGLAHLIEAAPGQITDRECQELAKAVAKVTDGHNATEILREWGIAKLDPSKEALKARGAAKPEPEAPEDEEAAWKEMEAKTKADLAAADFLEWATNTNAFFLKRRQWMHLSDEALAEAKTIIRAIAATLGIKEVK